MNLAELTSLAMLGTERRDLPRAPDSPAALDRLLARVDRTSRERALLSSAAILAAHERTGRRPRTETSPLPAPCPDETRPLAPEAARALLARLLAGEFPELLPEWLDLAIRAACLAPPELLPALLDAGLREPSLRPALPPVLGERGRWLATQNAAWQGTAGPANDDDAAWQSGSSADRLVALSRLRASTPELARQRLESSWKTESPDDRAAFLATLETGLSPADEAFLEVALDDRRKEVRQTAARLLSRLPDSAFAHRMLERARAFLRFVPGVEGSLLRLRAAKPPSFDVTLPPAFEKAWQRDGIDAKAPTGFGEKAWWLIQIVESVPLPLWQREWNVEPGQILAAARHGEWSRELLEAWFRATVRQRHAEWAEPLLAPAWEFGRFPDLPGLLAALAPARQEALLSPLLSDSSLAPELAERLAALLPHLSHAWSASFSRLVLEFLRRLSGRDSMDWNLRQALSRLAPRIAPETLAEAPNGWPTDAPGWAFWSKGLDDLLAAIQFRGALRHAFPPPPSPNHP